MPRYGRTDANQNELVATAEAMGCSVFDTSAVGRGFPDSVIGLPNGYNLLVEFKDGSKPPSKRKKTGPQVILHNNWVGQIDTVSSREELVSLINKWRVK